jgi:hypothetical protein
MLRLESVDCGDLITSICLSIGQLLRFYKLGLKEVGEIGAQAFATLHSGMPSGRQNWRTNCMRRHR